MKMRVTTLIILVSLFVVVVNGGRTGNYNNNDKFKPAKGLEMNFYRKLCPQFHEIVRGIARDEVRKDATLAAKLLRLHYHDCFVRGCDASILIDPVNGNNSTEKNAGPNRSISGYEVIDKIKAKLEKVCSKTVSCADIVAVSARDAVSYPLEQKDGLWPVYTGRRDGRVSNATEASRDLPSGGSNFTTLLNLFAKFGLNKFDLVSLSGAHTIGVTHCGVVQRRVFNFTGKGDSDPDLSVEYAQALKAQCGSPPNSSIELGLDRGSSRYFDSHYYMGLTRKEGLLTSDAALLKDNEAQNLVNKFKNPKAFTDAFAISMVNMGNIGVLTGEGNGEIRRNCRMVN